MLGLAQAQIVKSSIDLENYCVVDISSINHHLSDLKKGQISVKLDNLPDVPTSHKKIIGILSVPPLFLDTFSVKQIYFIYLNFI